jgi:sugar phosphate isomerase/epimerase
LSVHTIGFGALPVAAFLPDLAAHDITRVGLTMVQLEAGSYEANVRGLRAAGVDPVRWPAEQKRLERCVDVTAELGAPILYLTTGSARALLWDAAAARFAEAVAPVVDYAREAGVTLTVENTTTMRADIGFVHTLADLVELAQIADVAVCADLFSAWTDRDMPEAIAAGVSSFALVQVADFVLGTFSTPDRAVPGDGDVDIARQLRWLAAAGYDGVIEVEMSGPRITAEGPAAANARALAVIEGLLNR